MSESVAISMLMQRVHVHVPFVHVGRHSLCVQAVDALENPFPSSQTRISAMIPFLSIVYMYMYILLYTCQALIPPPEVPSLPGHRGIFQ